MVRTGYRGWRSPINIIQLAGQAWMNVFVWIFYPNLQLNILKEKPIKDVAGEIITSGRAYGIILYPFSSDKQEKKSHPAKDPSLIAPIFNR